MTPFARKISMLSCALILAAACVPPALAMPVEEFGQQVARTLQEGDGDAFSALLDKRSMLDRTLAGIDGREEFVTGLRKGLERGLSQVGAVLVRTMGPDVELSYLRTRTVDGGPRALLRVNLGDRGIDYIDFHLRQERDGSWRIVDWVDYVQGQTYTDSLRMAIALMVKDEPSLVGRLMGLPEVDRTSVGKFVELGKRSQQGDWSGWLEVYRTLPAHLRESRVLLTGRVAAAGAVDDEEEYLNAMAELRAKQGDDPTLSLTLVDYYLLTGDYERAYGAVDRLDAYTGGDAALTNLRAGIALHAGDNAASVGYARRAVAQDADYEDAYWNLLVAGCRSGDFHAAMEGVRALENRFGFEFSEEQLVQSEDLGRLVSSDEWQSWRRAAGAE